MDNIPSGVFETQCTMWQFPDTATFLPPCWVSFIIVAVRNRGEPEVNKCLWDTVIILLFGILCRRDGVLPACMSLSISGQ